MRFGYDFGGLSVSSGIALESLRKAQAGAEAEDADIELALECAKLPMPDDVLFRWPGRYGLSLKRVGTDWLFESTVGAAFQIKPDGRRVLAFSPSGEPDIGFMDVLARRVLPRIAILHGAVPLHAAALANETGALLLAAPSGFGKSTFTAMLARRHGWDALSDDISLLRHAAGMTTVSPTATGICLRPDSRKALGLSDAQCRSMPGYEGKLWYGPDPIAVSRSRPLRALVVLSRGADLDTHTVRRLSAVEGFILATSQLIHFNPLASANGDIAYLMTRLSRAMDGVPSYLLSYPADFGALGVVTDELAKLLQ